MKHPVRPTIAVTIGDPAGIGPEVVAGALADEDLAGAARYVVLGDARAFDPQPTWPETVTFVDFANAAPGVIAARAPTAGGGRASVEYVERAVELALAGEVGAIVTGPISKTALALAGIPYPGHSELLAERTGARRWAMMFAADRLRVTLVTVHQALRAALEGLTAGRVVDAVELTHRALVEWFGLDRPRLALAGVNPHAGEGGLFGDEEERVLRPALEEVRGKGIDCAGPLPADTVFLRASRGRFDAVVATYHDQGLIPVKLLAFESAVNLTLGLPIVRTSVDHGTAYDIAGTGSADPGSMRAALRLAIDIARRRGRTGGPNASTWVRDATGGRPQS